MKINAALQARRRFANRTAEAAAIASTALGIGVLALILITLVGNGVAGFSLKLITENTPPPGSDGGLANAIVGSLMMTILGTVVGAPAGVLAGTWLAEFGRDSWLANLTRFVNDILMSAPSILIGLFIYEILVVPTSHFSGIAGGVALAVIVVPVVLRTTEDMLRLVPNGLREACAALGAPQWRVIVSICWRAARAGVTTGILLAVARVSGETAPLLFTALNNQFWSLDLTRPIANLPVVIFQFAMSPYDDWRRLAWAGALLITLAILLLSILARSLLRSSSEAR